MARGMKAARYVRFWGQQHAGMYIKQMWLGAGVRTCGVGKSSNGRAAMLSLLQKLGEGYRHLCMYRCTVGNPELFPLEQTRPTPLRICNGLLWHMRCTPVWILDVKGGGAIGATR